MGMQVKHLGAIFIAGIMILSIFAIALSSATQPDSGKLDYNGIEFTQTPQGNWRFKHEGDRWEFYFFPEQVEGYGFPAEAGPLLDQPGFVMSYDARNLTTEVVQGLAAVHFYLENQLARMNKFIERGAVGVEALPELDCSIATAERPVIIFESVAETEISEIVLDNNCIRIKAITPGDAFALSERLLYHMLGVVP